MREYKVTVLLDGGPTFYIKAEGAMEAKYEAARKVHHKFPRHTIGEIATACTATLVHPQIAPGSGRPRLRNRY